MKILHYRDICTKKRLFALYLNQYSERQIRRYINDIIVDYRPDTTCKNISLMEAQDFIQLYGAPVGYQLSEELKKMTKK